MIFESKADILSFDFRNKLTKKILFSNFVKNFDESTKTVIEPKFKFGDSLLITKDHKYNSSNDTIRMTIGRYIFSIFCLNNEYISEFGLVVDEIKKKEYQLIAKNMSSLMLKGAIDNKEYADFLDRIEWLGNLLSNVGGDSFNGSSLTLTDNIKEKLDELIFSVKAQQLVQDPQYVKEVEKVLIDLVKKEMGDEGLIRIIESGAKGSFGNNFKNLALFRGLVGNDFISDNLTNGNSFDSYTKLGDNAVMGSYGRSIRTADGGYSTKLLLNAFNSLSISEPDCNTPETLSVFANNINRYKYRYIKDRRSGLVLLTPDNMQQYEGKLIQLRSPMLCRSKKGICEVCFGDLWKHNRMKNNLSVYVTNISSSIMNTSMKSFHNAESKYSKIDFRALLLK